MLKTAYMNKYMLVLIFLHNKSLNYYILLVVCRILNIFYHGNLHNILFGAICWHHFPIILDPNPYVM